jgi:hypothetical protein
MMNLGSGEEQPLEIPGSRLAHDVRTQVHVLTVEDRYILLAIMITSVYREPP